MRSGFLSQYFEAVASKRLSTVETDARRSNQHEFNGSRELKAVFGTGAGGKMTFPATFIWFGRENEGISNEGFVTWYDARENHPIRSEYRLYFPTNIVTSLAQQGDTLFIARRTDDSIMIIYAAADSTIANQLHWLFGLPRQENLSFELQEFNESHNPEIDFVARYILDELGIDIEEPETDRLDSILAPFGAVFPSTRIFSDLARRNLEHTVSPVEDPDGALIAWMNFEEALFRRLERHVVARKLHEGFTNDGVDVDGFISFSLSVQNRRKARAGFALENHLEEIFRRNSLLFDRGAITEGRSKPDFLFPGARQYHDSSFDTSNLLMLGAKSSCKDRWRQIISEAARIETKHLLTLEPAISTNQTNEMISNHVQLVLPDEIISTYQPDQQSWIMNLASFMSLVREKQ
jgi:hypothetical protein